MFPKDKTPLLYDIESYPNDFLVVFRRLEDGEIIRCGRDNYRDVLGQLAEAADGLFFVGYHNARYDTHLLTYLLANRDAETYVQLARSLHEMTTDIIRNQMWAGEVRGKYGLTECPQLAEFDVSAYADQIWRDGSLKGWECRLGMESVEELPFPIDKAEFTDAEYETLFQYCEYDVEATSRVLALLANKVESKTALIANFFKGDTSKYLQTDRSLVEDILSSNAPFTARKGDFKYNPPVAFTFQSPELQGVYDDFRSQVFYGVEGKRKVLENGQQIEKKFTNDFTKSVKLSNGLEVEFALGGIHGVKPRSYHENVIDADVGSYYPNLIVNYGLYNPENFTNIAAYANMIRLRVKHKRENPDLALAEKLVLNTTYGALNYKRERGTSLQYGKLYDVLSQIHVCITGQLLLAKLIDELLVAGYDVIYANTDGISFLDNGDETYKSIFADWQTAFGLALDTQRFAKFWVRDVNNYVAVKDDGELKCKGVYNVELGSSSYAKHRITMQAVLAQVVSGVPIEETIANCDDPSAFTMFHKYRPSGYPSIGLYPSDEANALRVALADKDSNPDQVRAMLRHDFRSVVRYALGRPTLRNEILAVSKEGAPVGRENTFSVIPVHRLSELDMSQVDKSRYVEIAYTELAELLPSGEVVAPHIKAMIDEVAAKVGVGTDHLIPADGKITIKGDVFLPNVYTLKLITGAKSKVLCLDVDNPTHLSAHKLLKYLRRDDLIVRSSNFTLDDVFAGNCRYKVLYAFDGGFDLPSKKNNKAVECFYAQGKSVGIIGRKGDGSDYLMTGSIRPLNLDVNDILEESVPQFSLTGNKERKKGTRKPKDELAGIDASDAGERVEVGEFNLAIDGLVPNPDKPKIAGDGRFILFPCLFPEMHAKGSRNNRAYAFKRNGHYVVKCHGNVCQARYDELNAALQANSVKTADLPELGGLTLDTDKKLIVLQAPTGSGKTEALAEEIIKAVKNNGKITVLVQSKEAITRLLSRVEDKIGREGSARALVEQGKIFPYTMETNDTEEALDPIMVAANVVISHHAYFSPSGQAWKIYKALRIMAARGGQCLIDEGNAWFEGATRIPLKVAALYHTPQKTRGRYILSGERLTAQKASDLIAAGDADVLTKIVHVRNTNEFSQLSVNIDNHIPAQGSPDLIDLLAMTQQRFTTIESVTDREFHYTLLANQRTAPLSLNSDPKTFTIADLLDPTEYVITAEKVGDAFSRKEVGSVYVTYFSEQIVRMVLAAFSRVWLISATFTPYQLTHLRSIADFHHEVVEEEIRKVKTIVLLTNPDNRRAEVMTRMMNLLQDQPQVKALVFAQTLEKAREFIRAYPNAMMNDNGQYVSIMNPAHAAAIGHVFNVTISGLEAMPAKGYNYKEEVGIGEPGFRLMYFDSPPVSPAYLRKGVIDGHLVDYAYDHAVVTFTQAIGRAMRKEKDLLVIAINDSTDDVTDIISTYLEAQTNARIVRAKLDSFNLNLLLAPEKALPGTLAQSSLYQEVADVLKGAA